MTTLPYPGAHPQLTDAIDLLFGTPDLSLPGTARFKATAAGLMVSVDGANWVLMPALTPAPFYTAVRNVKQPYPVGSPTFPGAVGDGTTDDTAAFVYYMGLGPGQVFVPVGTYRVKPGFTISSGIRLFGENHAFTRLKVDDSLGNAGADVFTSTNQRGWAVEGMTIDAPSGRTAGRMFMIKGGDSSEQLVLGISSGGNYIDVDSNNQFMGVEFADNAGIGDFRTTIGDPKRRAWWRNMSAGAGFGIFFNTPHGASQVVNNVFITGAVGATGPAVWYRGSGDITLNGVQTFGMSGWVFDPQANCAAALDASIQMNNCQWDSGGPAATPNMLWTCGPSFNAAACVVFAQLTNNWVAGATGDGVKITGPGLRDRLYFDWKSGACYSNTGFGINVTDTLATVLDFAGNPQINVSIASSTNGAGGSALTNTTLGIPFRSNGSGAKSYT